MEALILLELGDELILHTADMQKRRVTFHGYDFENDAMIVRELDELVALEFEDIDYAEFLEPIERASMINNKLALSQQTVDRWRDSHRTKSLGTDINIVVGNGVLTASTK